jgi:hypothetical protein
MLSKQLVRLVLHIRDKGFLTKRNQKIFSGLGYYLATWKLRDEKIIYNDGVTGERANEKIWKLTDKGKLLADLLERQILLNKKIDEELRK